MKARLKTKEQNDWAFLVKKETFGGPPYDPQLQITPESKFGDHVWIQPKYQFASGNKNRTELNFLSWCKTSEGRRKLCPVNDRLLLNQLKDAMIAIKYHRHALSDNLHTYTSSALSWNDSLVFFRKLFVGASLFGLRSISGLNDQTLQEIFKVLGASAAGQRRMLDHLEHLCLFSKSSLIRDCTPIKVAHIAQEIEVIDSTREVGVQPLKEYEINAALKASLPYIDHCDTVASIIRKVRDSDESVEFLRKKLQILLPLDNEFSSQDLVSDLVVLTQVACSNIIGLHFGPRPSELLSLLRGFVQRVDGRPSLSLDKITVSFQTFKAIKEVGGITRHLDAPEYMVEVSRALEVIMDAAGFKSNYVFSDPDEEEELSTNRWNHRIRKFCKAHNLSFTYSGRTWRTSLISVMVLALDNPMPAIAAIMNHKSTNVGFGYAHASPFYRAEFLESYTFLFRRRYKTLFEGSVALGGKGLGGKQGIHIEKHLPLLFSVDVTEQDMKLTLDQFIDDLMDQGIWPTIVRPGVVCVKGQKQRGACSTRSGDALPDTGKCSDDCVFQVQTAQKRETLQWELRRLAEQFSVSTSSKMQKTFWAVDISKRVRAWPDLIPLFLERLRSNEKLQFWFPDWDISA